MKTNLAIQNLEQKILQIKNRLRELGPLRPGSLSRQYNVCGKPGCRCKDPANPRRHGPYYQLNYVYDGKKKSQFIRREDVKVVQAELANYKLFRKTTNEWIGLAIRLAQIKLKDSP